MELSTEPKPRSSKSKYRPHKQSSSTKLRKVDTASSLHSQDIAQDEMPPPSSIKRHCKGGFLRLLSKAVPCISGKGSALLDPEDLCSPRPNSIIPSEREEGTSRSHSSSPALSDAQATFDPPARGSRVPSFSRGFNPTPESARTNQDWISTTEMETSPLGILTPPSISNVALSPPISTSLGGLATHDLREVDNTFVRREVLSDLSVITEAYEARYSDQAIDTSSLDEVPTPRRMSWGDIFNVMRENLEDDPASLPAGDLECFLSALGLSVSKKEAPVEEMSLFQLNKVVTDHEERDAQTIMDWLVIHPEATGFLSTYPALTRLVEVDAETNEIVNTTSFISITGDLVEEVHAGDSMESLPSVYSQCSLPHQSSENVPELLLTLPTEDDLADVGTNEEEVPAPELLNVAWVPKPSMRRRRVYSAMPPKRRGISRLRKVASAPDLQLVAAGSGFDNSEDEETLAGSREVSAVFSTSRLSGDSTMAEFEDASASTIVLEEEGRNSDPVDDLLSASENILEAKQVDSGDSASVLVSAFDAGVSRPADDDGASVTGFVSAPSSPVPDNHTVDASADGQAVDDSACETEGHRSRPVGIHGPLDMASLRWQMNKVEEIIIATASQRASVSAPGTPVEKPATPTDPRDKKARRRGSMGYKPRPISGIRPLMLPMRVALRDLDDNGNSRTTTHPPGTVAPQDAPARNIVPF